jgi:hypothetical protein
MYEIYAFTNKGKLHGINAVPILISRKMKIMCYCHVLNDQHLANVIAFVVKNVDKQIINIITVDKLESIKISMIENFTYIIFALTTRFNSIFFNFSMDLVSLLCRGLTFAIPTVKAFLIFFILKQES